MFTLRFFLFTLFTLFTFGFSGAYCRCDTHPYVHSFHKGDHSPNTTSASSGKLFTGDRCRVFDREHIKRLPHPHPRLRSVLQKFSTFQHHRCQGWAVVTTIFPPSQSLYDTLDLLDGWCFVVVADKKGPLEYNVQRRNNNQLVYLTVEIQQALAQVSVFVRSLPWNHFGRKNIGYFWAIYHNATRVWDFDDDNALTTKLDNYAHESFLSYLLPNYSHPLINPYPLYGASNAWPRGYPLSAIKDRSYVPLTNETLKGRWNMSRVAVVQGLANHDPDVDAVYRLTRDLPLSFTPGSNARGLVVPRGTLTPFNAQATLYQRSALFALYLPVTVHGRVSDIWRSYVFQYVFWRLGLNIVIGGPMVVQHRNPHQYLADFQAEGQLYEQSGALVRLLTTYNTTAENVPDLVTELFVELYERFYIGFDDVLLVKHWLTELEHIGYEFPTFPKKFALVVRTYGKEGERLNKWLIPTLHMFVDCSKFEFIMVFDNEAEADHKLGNCFASNFNYKVYYEELPPNSNKVFPGIAWVGHGQTSSGYDRQQWSTFHLDRYSNADIIGVIDSDAMLYSYLTEDSILGADNRIFLRLLKAADPYPNDAVAVKLPTVWLMGADIFPMWFKRETFAHVRSYVEDIWGTSFDNAFSIFSQKQYSQFNIMGSYAAALESAHYRDVRSSDKLNGVISVGRNRYESIEREVLVGCCRSFGVACELGMDKEIAFVYRWNRETVAWLDNPQFAQRYFENVQTRLNSVNATVLAAHKQVCAAFAARSVYPYTICT